MHHTCFGTDSMWATRLHLYGDDEDEIARLSSTNQVRSMQLNINIHPTNR